MDASKCCISFSPNWFYQQIVQMKANLIGYGANDKVYVYNFVERRFLYSLQGTGKVSLLYFHENVLFVGCEGGVISVFEGEKFLSHIELNIKLPYFMYYKEDEFVVFDERGVGLSLTLLDYKVVKFSLFLITQPHCLPKFVDDEIVIYQSGRIVELGTQKHIELMKRVMSASKYGKRYALLCKQAKEKDEQGEENKKEKKFLKIEVFEGLTQLYDMKIMIAPNKKLPILKGQSVSIKMLNSEEVLLSTKQGEFYRINITKGDSIKLDPNSLAADKIPIELHFQGVYLIGGYQEYLFTVGLDRRINILKNLDLEWRIVCLSSKASNFQRGCESGLLYFQDQGLKALDMSKAYLYVNHFWKVNPFNTYSICEYSEDIIAFVRDDRLELENLMKEIKYGSLKCDDPIGKLIWLNDIEQYSHFFVKNENQKKPLFKGLDIDIYLVIIFLTGRFQLINLKDGVLMDNEFITSRLKEDYFPLKLGTVLFQKGHLVFAYNDNKLHVQNKDGSDNITIHNQAITSICWCDNVIVTGCANQTIGLSMFRYNKLQLLGYLKHKYPIEKVVSYKKNIGVIAKCHQSIQIYDISNLKQIASKDSLQMEKCNIRGHSGYVIDVLQYNDDLIVSSSEDQTIKIFNINEIVNKHPPNKKKNKKKTKI